MIKYLLLIIFIFPLLETQAQLDSDTYSKYQIFLSFGNVSPLGNFKGNSKSSHPIEIAKSTDFTKNVNGGIDFYFFEKIAITGGLALYN